MKASFEDFERVCRERLRFLVGEFGFNLIKTEKEPSGVFITFQGPTTALRISLEPREGGIFILLTRLVRGKIPPYPIFVEPETPLNSFHLDDLIQLKAPGFLFSFRRQKVSSRSELNAALEEIADALRKYADEVLKGNFEVFGELSRVVKKRQKTLANRK
jgi:hypothetical protein